MSAETDNHIRTALRQAGAIAAVGGQHSVRQMLGLAHALYDSLIVLKPEDRARKIRLIDAIFCSQMRDPEHKHSQT